MIKSKIMLRKQDNVKYINCRMKTINEEETQKTIEDQRFRGYIDPEYPRAVVVIT